jgi:hypothetical protein
VYGCGERAMVGGWVGRQGTCVRVWAGKGRGCRWVDGARVCGRMNTTCGGGEDGRTRGRCVGTGALVLVHVRVGRQGCVHEYGVYAYGGRVCGCTCVPFCDVHVCKVEGKWLIAMGVEQRKRWSAHNLSVGLTPSFELR